MFSSYFVTEQFMPKANKVVNV